MKNFYRAAETAVEAVAAIAVLIYAVAVFAGVSSGREIPLSRTAFMAACIIAVFGKGRAEGLCFAAACVLLVLAGTVLAR